MKRRSLVLLPAVFLLVLNIAVAADQPAVVGEDPDGDQTAQRQQRAREVPNHLVRLENLVDATGLAPGAAAANWPLLDERPGQRSFSFKQSDERQLAAASPYRGARPYRYNGMTFWWIPLSTVATGPVELLEPK